MVNKKGFKCFGLLFLLSIMFGLSFVVSSDVSALTYSITSFPLYRSYFDTYAEPEHRFNLVFSDSYTVGTSPLLSSNYTFRRRYGDYPTCAEYSPSHIFTTYSSSSFSGGSEFDRDFSSSPSCSDDVSDYTFDSFYIADYNVSNGNPETVVNIDKLIFDNNSGTRNLSKITLPINFDRTQTFSAGTPLEIQFGLVTEATFGFSNFTTPHVDFTYYYSHDSTYSYSSVNCSINDSFGFITGSGIDDLTGAYSGFLVSCSFIPEYDVSNFTSSLSIYGGSSLSPTPFLSYDSSDGLYFSSSYLITDNANVWSGISVSPTPSGTDLTSAPGYTQLYGTGSESICSSGDFFCSLSNLFTFGFFNPFAPIFQMFSDNNSCASIPTISGMIHSEETEVCPWFSSSIRNIVTPVLGLSSMMLIFGFAVRWLGSSSGNLFEDSRHEEVSNQGGRWGHFRKGGS